MIKLGCYSCKSLEHGETLDSAFYCFKCMLATKKTGNFKIQRDEDGSWKVEISMNGKLGWIHIYVGGNPVEDLYQSYLARMIVT